MEDSMVLRIESFAKKFCAIATDMDGTFFGPRMSLSQATLDAYKRAIREGIIVIPTTGRGTFGVSCALQAASALKDISLFPGVYMNGCISYGLPLPSPPSATTSNSRPQLRFKKSPDPSSFTGNSPLVESSCSSTTAGSVGENLHMLSTMTFSPSLAAVIPEETPDLSNSPLRASARPFGVQDDNICVFSPVQNSNEDISEFPSAVVLAEHTIELRLVEKVVDFVRQVNEREMAAPNWEAKVNSAPHEHGFAAVTDFSLPPSYISLMAYTRDCIITEKEDQLSHGLHQFRDGIIKVVGSLVDYCQPAPDPSPVALGSQPSPLLLTRTLLKKASDLRSETSTDDTSMVAESDCLSTSLTGHQQQQAQQGPPQSHQIYKLLILGHSGELISQLRNEVNALVGEELDLVSAVSRILELTPKGVNKAMALEGILSHLNIHPSQVLALGDGENDMQLLKTCGFSVAMGNANSALKKIAHFVTKDNHDDGWAYAVNKFLDARESAYSDEEDE